MKEKPTKKETSGVATEGFLLDYIDGKSRKSTNKEKLRQTIEHALVLEYKFPRNRIGVDVSITVGSAKKKQDLVVYASENEMSQSSISILIHVCDDRTSPEDRDKGVSQLKIALANCEKAEFGMWFNGLSKVCLQKIEGKFDYDFREIIDFPGNGQTLDQMEELRRKDLRKASADNLLYTFDRCHDYIHGNQGLSKPAAFLELLKLIFCKIEDEKSRKLQFFVRNDERLTPSGQDLVKQRIRSIFDKVKRNYQSIFKLNEDIELEPRVLAFVVSQLQGYTLLETAVDVKGTAYESIIGSNLRGDKGEFFTPRNVVKMCVRMLDPGPDKTIIDPACGTGGFLINVLNYVGAKILSNKYQIKTKQEFSQSLFTLNTEELNDEQLDNLRESIKDYASDHVYGLDLNPDLVRATKMNMVMNNDGQGNIFKANSLLLPSDWDPEVRSKVKLGTFDYVFTNPPFGSKIPIDDPRILAQYDLAKYWDKVGDVWKLDVGRLQSSVPPEILFIERCIQFLKPGLGIMAIVLPDGVLGNPGLEYVRVWILKHCKVLASVDLAIETFLPSTGTQTSILVLKRKSEEELRIEEHAKNVKKYPVFMAIVNKVGKDRRGNPIFKRDDSGKEITIEGERTLDDETEEIPVLFRKFRGKVVQNKNGIE